jgi:hypothetical protein
LFANEIEVENEENDETESNPNVIKYFKSAFVIEMHQNSIIEVFIISEMFNAEETGIVGIKTTDEDDWSDHEIACFES